MIIELTTENFRKAKYFFKDVYFNLNSLAVINGDNDGRIWVDSLDNPKTGMIVDNEWSIYVTGDHTNKEFNREASQIIREEIFPVAEQHALKLSPEYNNGEWIIYYPREEWLEAIEQDFGIRDIIPLRRNHYIFQKEKIPNWREKILPDYRMQRVDEEFLKNNHLENFNVIEEWIATTWRSTEDFLSKGFAFCLVKNEKIIISWGIADWVTGNQAEMGIGTDEKYRRRGFASLVTAAAAEYCKKNGIELGWHCSEHNTGSWKTAEKVGFKKERDYTAALGCFDENHNLWENAWYVGLYLKRPEEGLSFINRLIDRIEPEARHMNIKAQILIQAEQYEEALEHLNKAVDLGLQNPEKFKSNLLENDFFRPIKDLQGFPILLNKIDQAMNQK